MNNYTQYAGYFLTGWAFLQLVGFLYTAYPVTRMLGNIIVIFIVLGALSLGVIELIKAKNNNYGRRKKDLIVFIPSILIIILFFLPLIAGSFIAG